MKRYKVEKDEAIVIFGPERLDLYAPMMEGDVELPEDGIPENIQFATALVFLTKTDPDFRAWVTEKWQGLVDKFIAEQHLKERKDEV